MSHFAHVTNGIVDNVIVVEQDVIDSGLFGPPNEWIQTSYNTKNGVHVGPDGLPDGGVALRGHFAGIGFTYDAEHDVFYPPKPVPSWILNTTTWSWEPPTPMPTTPADAGKVYQWNETTLSWDQVVFPPPPSANTVSGRNYLIPN